MRERGFCTTSKRTYFNLKVDLSHTELLRNCEHLFTEPSEKSIPEKHVRGKLKSHSSVNLQSSFMKNEKATHSPNCCPSGKEMNSLSLFSCSNHSLFSSSSSPLLLVEEPASFSDSNINEPDAPSVINQSESENRFVQNGAQAITFYSIPCYANRTSKRLHRMCTPAGVSPLLSDSRGPSPYNEPDISALGTPVLFSQMSASSL